MKSLFARKILLLASAGVVPAIAYAGTETIGLLFYDVSIPRSTSQFDLYNGTGPNSTVFPDPTFPVTTPVSLSSLSLTVNYTSGPSETFGTSYFTLSPDGLSFDGSAIPIGGANPQPVSATLTGNFSPTTISLNGGTTVTILPSFSTSISDTSGSLADGDFGIINATTGSPVPEPSSLLLFATVLLGLAYAGRRSLPLRQLFSSFKAHKGAASAILLCLMVVAPNSQAQTAIQLSTATVPGTGVAGITDVSIVGTGFPSGGILPSNVTVTLAATCGGAPLASVQALSVTTVFGSIRRLQFQIPGTLAQGTDFVSVAGSVTGGASFTSSNCSEVAVTHTNPVLSACLPSSSLGVLSPKTAGSVTAYVPNGSWEGGPTGLRVVPLEGAGSPTGIVTPAVVNSCSSNPATGQTVCTGNNTDVYLITGSTLKTTLHSGSNGYASFSGGSCFNCGVAINALSNKAVINMGVTGLSGDGVQVLDLSTNTFLPPTPSANAVSENISIDPTRGLVLSPSENYYAPGSYDLFQIDSTTGALTEFQNKTGTLGSRFLDSAAEDCSTGIALSTSEGTLDLFIGDITQATFTAGTPGSWTAPGQFQTFPEFSGMGAGTSGISVAPGSLHLGIVAGEFGTNRIGVIQLPSTSGPGTGTPSIVDYAATNLASTFSLGYDPHTLTAYTSPNNGVPYGVLSDSPVSTLAVVDLACLISKPRATGHNVDPTVASTCIKYVPTF